MAVCSAPLLVFGLAATVLAQATQPAATQPRTLSAEELMQRAGEALASGQLQKAVQMYDAVTRVQSDNGPAWLGLAEAHLGLGNLVPAADAYNRCRKLMPNNWRVLFGLGTVYLQQGYHKLARSLLEKSEGLAPPNERARIYVNLALTYRGLHRLDDAIERVRQALALESSNIDARQILVTLYAEAGRLDEAMAETRATIELLQSQLREKPDDRQILEQMARFWSLLADLLQGKISKAPNDATAYLQLAGVLEQISLVNMQLGYHRALEQCRRAVELAPENPEALFAQARLEYLIGRVGAAAEGLRKVLQIKPEHGAARELLGKIEAATTRPAGK